MIETGQELTTTDKRQHIRIISAKVLPKYWNDCSICAIIDVMDGFFNTPTQAEKTEEKITWLKILELTRP